ncbi:membrane protein insertion efficiency factor YidD [Falsiroseomonas sp. HC035]|uniref:membrane protein insertion efficiency factor YidD n=1 Tax=Falsiroseomonas sp. HC035 TaxID=3390999 RepID=UPI003D31BE77
MTPQQHLLRGAIRTYQLTLRPFIGCNCRFYPHCSEFGLEAVATHGAMRGGWLTARRVLRCNPWHPGGYDPVPPLSQNVPASAPLAEPRPTKG